MKIKEIIVEKKQRRRKRSPKYYGIYGYYGGYSGDSSSADSGGEGVEEENETTIRLSPTSERAKAWIEKVYTKFPNTWQNNHVMMWGEGEDQQLALFELVPSMSKKDAVEIKWFQAYPLQQGVGSKAMRVLQDLAEQDGISLTLYPWDKGKVSQAKLIKFYKKHGFKPSIKGSKNMQWEPTQGVAENFVNKVIQESLDSPYSYHWEEGDFGDLNAYAQLSDNTVLDIEFEQFNVDKSQWAVAFQRDGQIHKTGKGDEQRVFATVLSAIKEFIENKQPKEVFFSATRSTVNPESRKRLYDRLVQKYATALGYQAAQSETDVGTNYKFSRIRKQGVAENFADGRNPGRKGLAKRVGVNCKQPVSKLRKIAKNSSGEKQRMAHWCANMKSGKNK